MKHYYGYGPLGQQCVVTTDYPLWWMWDDTEQQGYWVNTHGGIQERSTFTQPMQGCVPSERFVGIDDYLMDVGL